MVKLKIFIFNKLADLFLKITQSNYYKKQLSKQHLIGFKTAGENCSLHESSSIINPQYISIGNDFRSSWNLRLEAIDYYKGQRFNPKILIGDNVGFNTDIHIGCINHVEIGNNCLLGSRIIITDHNHGDTSLESLKVEPSIRKLYSKGPVIIEDNCWIGEGAAILAGVTIGRNSIIGTNSVVNKDIPAYSIVAGIPAKIIKYYS